MDYQRPSFPEELSRCLSDDPISRKLYQIANTINILSWVMGGLTILFGLIFALEMSNGLYDEELFFGIFFGAIASAVCVFGILRLISILVRGYGQIVQSTKLSADAALYNAAVNAYGQYKDDNRKNNNDN